MKILFFIAAQVATAAEQRQIDALTALTSKGYEIGVRTALSNVADMTPNEIEDCDFVAGSVPTEYDDIPTFGIYDDGSKAHIFECYPPIVTDLMATHTKSLQVVEKQGADLDDVAQSVETSNLTYASDDTDVATVGASTGIVTGVAAGSCNISITHGAGASLAVTLCPITVIPHVA